MTDTLATMPRSFLSRDEEMSMPPEKVAVLVITAVIAVLVSVTLIKSPERTGSKGSGTEGAVLASGSGSGLGRQEPVAGPANRIKRSDIIGGSMGTRLKRRRSEASRPVRKAAVTPVSSTDAGRRSRIINAEVAEAPAPVRAKPVARRNPRRETKRSVIRPSTRTHVVKDGENPTTIAKQYYGAGWSHIQALLKANPKVNPRTMRPGTTLVLPASSGKRSSKPTRDLRLPKGAKTYTVVSGDNLRFIARKTLGAKKEWRRIWEANSGRLKSKDQLLPGMKLIIPR